MSDKLPREELFEHIEKLGYRSEDLEGTVLVGFLTIAEWRGPNGAQWLAKISGDHSDSLPTWRQRGYAIEVVNDMWGDMPSPEGEAE